MLKAPMLLAAVLVVCVASSADARRRHHGYYGERTPPSFDDWRRVRAARDNAQDPQQGREQDPQQARDEDPQQDRAQDSEQARGQARGELRRNMQWFHLPVVDASIPDERFESRWAVVGEELRLLLGRGLDVLVHCRGGLGRAGTIAARLLVELGMEPTKAIAKAILPFARSARTRLRTANRKNFCCASRRRENDCGAAQWIGLNHLRDLEKRVTTRLAADFRRRATDFAP
jgi:hypothetical protein